MTKYTKEIHIMLIFPILIQSFKREYSSAGERLPNMHRELGLAPASFCKTKIQINEKGKKIPFVEKSFVQF